MTAPGCDWSVDLVPLQLGPVPAPTPPPKAIVPALFGPTWIIAHSHPNPDHLTAALAREAVFEAGLVPGTCYTDATGGRAEDRVWQQRPVAGTLVDFGTPVDVWVGRDCDVYEGKRVILD